MLGRAQFILAAVTVVCQFSRADIVFLNLNNAPKEVEAAERAARKRGEKLIVVNPAEPGGKVTAKEMDRALGGMKAQGKSISTLFISGHNGNGHFFGEQGDLYAADIKSLCAKYPEVTSSMTGMALWGCYTSSEYAYQQFWKDIAPNLKVVGGFSLKSPSKDNKIGIDLAEDYLLKESAFVQAQGAADLEKAFRTLIGGEIKHSAFSVCTRDHLVSNPTRILGSEAYGDDYVISHEELKSMCDRFDVDSELKELFNAYDQARPGFENPRPEKSDKRLRKYYNQLQLWRHCKESLKQKTGYEMPNPARVIRLVFYDNLKDNIERLNSEELQDYNEMLRSMGLGRYAMDQLTRYSRAEIRNRLHEVERVAFKKIESAGWQDADLDRWEKLYLMATELDRTVLTLDTACSHFSLVDENPLPKKSLCMKSHAKAESLATRRLVLRQIRGADRLSNGSMASTINSLLHTKNNISERNLRYRVLSQLVANPVIVEEMKSIGFSVEWPASTDKSAVAEKKREILRRFNSLF